MEGQNKLNCLVFLALSFLIKINSTKIERDKACELQINIDEPLYQKYQRNIENITQLVDVHIKGLNAIFESTFFTHHYSHFYFRVKNIHIMSSFNYNKTTRHFGYLKQFTKYNSTGVCLSLIFTLRDFRDGIQGLAWRNTVCENNYNTGFITFLNHGRFTPTKDSIMTFAHEVAHSFGAKHNEATKCGSTDEIHGFIMSESGTDSRRPQFSPCSLHDMNLRMNNILVGKDKHLNCFIDRPKDDNPPSFCGNGVLEDGEECDCGLDYRTCHDSCCYSGLLSPEDILLGDQMRTKRIHGVQPTPCHRHAQDRCIRPWMNIITFALILPFSVISLMCLVVTAVLCWDWRRGKLLYIHVTHPKDLIRSETGHQLGRREEREANRLKGALLKKEDIIHHVPSYPAPPPPSSPPPPPTHRHPPPSTHPLPSTYPPPPPIHRPPPPPPIHKPSQT